MMLDSLKFNAFYFFCFLFNKISKHNLITMLYLDYIKDSQTTTVKEKEKEHQVGIWKDMNKHLTKEDI